VAKTALELGLLSPAEARQRENLARVVEGLDTSWTERELVRGLTAAQCTKQAEQACRITGLALFAWHLLFCGCRADLYIKGACKCSGQSHAALGGRRRRRA
jgi:hypothetical protein